MSRRGTVVALAAVGAMVVGAAACTGSECGGVQGKAADVTTRAGDHHGYRLDAFPMDPLHPRVAIRLVGTGSVTPMGSAAICAAVNDLDADLLALPSIIAVQGTEAGCEGWTGTTVTTFDWGVVDRVIAAAGLWLLEQDYVFVVDIYVEEPVCAASG